MIEREIAITYNDKKFIVKFPNVGQLMDIESLKMALTGGKYGTFAASGIKAMYFVLDMVDAISFFSVMCPRLKNFITQEDVDVDYTQMKPESVKPLVDIYKKDVMPWYNKIMTNLYASTNEAIEESESQRAEDGGKSFPHEVA